MPSKTVAAALFTANDGVVLAHRRSHIFEADRGFIDRNVIKLAKPVKHAGSGNRFDQSATLFPNLKEVKGEECINLKLIQEMSVFIHEADTVGVPVSSDAQIDVTLTDPVEQRAQIAFDRFRLPHAGKNGVALLIDANYRIIFTADESFKITGTGAEHGVHSQTKSGVF